MRRLVMGSIAGSLALAATGCTGLRPAPSAPADQALAARFEGLAGSLTRFFAKPRRLVATQTGPVFTVEEYTVVLGDHAVDSGGPAALAHIDGQARRDSNAFCGTISAGAFNYGWPTVDGALAAADRRDCPRPDGPHGSYPIRLSYAAENGRWVLRSVIRLDRGKPDWAISSALGLDAGDGVRATSDPMAVRYNRPWLQTKISR